MVAKSSPTVSSENSLLEKIKIGPKILKEDFDMTVLENIEYSSRFFGDHREIAGELAGKDPFLITVMIESLRPEYWRRKKYARQTRVAILPKYTELLYQYFFEEYGTEQGNEIYAKWLEKYRSLWKKEGRNKEIDDYIIENELDVRYKDKILKRFKNIQRLKKPRFRIARERHYHLPPPLDRVDWRSPYDNIFVWREKSRKFAQRGGSGSSGKREINSKFGFGFSLINRVRPVPSFLFLYSDENRLYFVKKYRSLCLPAYDLGANYFLSSGEENEILKGTKLFSWKSLSKVEEITVTLGRSQNESSSFY